MPLTSKEEKKALLGNFDMIPGPIKSLLGNRIKQAEDYVNSLIRYAVLPVKVGDNVALVSLMYSSKTPPIHVRPLYDMDDLRIIAYALIKAYNRLKPQATGREFIADLFSVFAQGEENQEESQANKGEDDSSEVSWS